MLGVEELKEEIEITDTTVECPVKGCNKEVERQRRKTRKYKDRFRCDIDKIVISPTTFVYPDKTDNLLWKERSDLDLLKKIETSKKGKSRFEHDNSEDAVSWNVFRFLEKNNLIEGFLGSITDTSSKSSEVIYWSYSQIEDNFLNSARTEFEKKKSWFSEPDIIIKTDNALFYIEAKFKATNQVKPTNKSEFKKYKTGGDNWFSEVFSSDYETVAIVERKYELMRFWLLGTWMAKQQDLDFYLINLVLSNQEVDIEAIFGKHIKENQRRKFLRVTWETIFQYISKSEVSSDKEMMMRYFRNKTIGYKIKTAKGIKKGILQKAFSS
ncbi:MAG: hypothetical protein ACTSV2_04205 [Candidatus Thorarchaeota archaeon]